MNVPKANEIVPGIWLGDRNAAKDDKWLNQNNITVVFNATKDLPFAICIKKQYRIPVDDNLQPEEIRNMTQWSQETVYKVLEEHNKERSGVLWIGRWEPRKNPEEFIRVIKETKLPAKVITNTNGARKFEAALIEIALV